MQERWKFSGSHTGNLFVEIINMATNSGRNMIQLNNWCGRNGWKMYDEGPLHSEYNSISSNWKKLIGQEGE